MADRVFSYPASLAKVAVKTAVDKFGHAIQVEFTSPEFVNAGFENMVSASSLKGWTSIHRGQQLDDLITALTYFRDEGEAIFE